MCIFRSCRGQRVSHNNSSSMHLHYRCPGHHYLSPHWWWGWRRALQSDTCPAPQSSPPLKLRDSTHATTLDWSVSTNNRDKQIQKPKRRVKWEKNYAWPLPWRTPTKPYFRVVFDPVRVDYFTTGVWMHLQNRRFSYPVTAYLMTGMCWQKKTNPFVIVVTKIPFMVVA